eukprot:CAMPEP_0202958594 /NCGR_PEP_ID=MMETSP1396-20130829/2900_1 /ASSEMBLY_ACC=CAM_ASM_000872 /TAXON_ID= /ORGANISM="Pseudokeronopsis sp., Strain Brazil" /LENGTH=73 /DNA_ID=CAMNT_0049676745 /DNA_START=915 /DNA_END=1136 /DNA_ORIENTATION=+
MTVTIDKGDKTSEFLVTDLIQSFEIHDQFEISGKLFYTLYLFQLLSAKGQYWEKLLWVLHKLGYESAFNLSGS